MRVISVLIILFFLITNCIFSQSSWYWQNPLPQGNNLHDIQVINTDIAYSCGDFGTILKTTNQGINWTILKTDPGYSSTSLYFIDSNTGFVVNTNSESHSSKILKTTNGGNIWTQSLLLSNTLIHNIEFCGLDTGYLFGENNFSDNSAGVIYKTINGGENWFQCNTGIVLKESFFFNCLTGYACGNFIYSTTDGGINWINYFTLNSVIESITFVNPNTGFALGYRWSYPPNPNYPKIWKTTDGGLNWSENSTVNDIYFEKIKFFNESTGLISGSNNLYKTTDTGLNWFNVTPSDLKSNSFDINSTGSGFIAGKSGLILNTQDFGSNWIDQFPSIRTGGYNIVKFWNEKIGYLTDEHNIYKTTNGGETWLLQKDQISLTLYDLTVIDSNIVYAAGGDTEFRSLFMKTTNGGEDWITINAPMGRPITSISFIDSITGYLSGSGYIVKTTNGGNTFIICSPVEYSYKVFFLNKDTGYVGGYTSIHKTTDGAVTWLDQPGFITTAIYFINSDTGFSAQYNNIIKKTTNGGMNWITKYNGTGGVRIHDIKFRNNDSGYAVGEKGTIIKTTNGGDHWFLDSSPTDNRLNSVDITENNVAFIGGAGSVILCSTNGGNVIGIEPQIEYFQLQFSISQNFPNPFNPVTNLEFQIPKSGLVSLKVYDLLGKEVANIVNENLNSGTYRYKFDGSSFASGVYFYKLVSGDFTEVKRMVLLK